MEIRDLGPGDIEEVAQVAARAQARLRARFPRLPVRDAAYFMPKLEWLLRQGPAVGAFDQGQLAGFIGAMVVDGFLHEGRAAYSPDLGNAVDATPAVPAIWRALYAAAATRWVADGALLHCLSVYVTDQEGIGALFESGFGKTGIDAVLDLTVDAEEGAGAADRPPAAPGGADVPMAGAIRCRDAAPGDAPALARLNAALAAHVASSPIFVRHARGKTPDEWAERLAASGSVVLVAEDRGTVAAYMTAREPQNDVSRAIHDPATLAIDGAFTEPAYRRLGVADLLLRTLIARARADGMRLLSVDYESTNAHASAFWGRRFAPFTVSLKRTLAPGLPD